MIWNGNWLTASPTSGTGSGIFSVGVDNSGLSTGTYRGSVTVMPWSSEGEETGNGSLVIPVTLMILDNTEKIPPTTPSGLTAAVSGPAQILLSWAPSTDTGGSGLAGYRLFRDGSFVAQPTATNYTDTGLTVGIEYTYAVLAVDHAENQSGLSQTVRVTLSPDLPPTEVEAFSYPEPARAGVSPVIRVLMGDVNGVEITIYDTGGTVVHTARMESPNVAVDGKAGYEYAWAGPIASGVYYAAIHGQTLTGPVRAKTKITVVR